MSETRDERGLADEQAVIPWATWPWNRCPARREDYSRCDLRKGHVGDHLLERGIGGNWPWSTEWTDEQAQMWPEPPANVYPHRHAYCGTCQTVVRDFQGDEVWRDRDGDMNCGPGFHAPRLRPTKPEGAER